MGFFKKVGRAFKNLGEGIADVAEDIAEGVSEIAEGITDVAGDITKGVTKVVAGEKAANKVGNFFDDRLEPAIKRSVKNVATVLNPLHHIGNTLEHGLIDGLSNTFAESVQDSIGSITRLVGGEKAEKKFDDVYDRKAQRWIEMGTRIIGTAVLTVVPGGAAVLAADAASEVASLGYRVSKGHKANWADALEVGGAVVGVGLASATTKAATSAITAGTKSATQTVATQGLISAGKVGTKSAQTAYKASIDASTKQAKALADLGIKGALKAGTPGIKNEVLFNSGFELALGNTISNYQQGQRGSDLLSLNESFWKGTPTTEKSFSSDTEQRINGDIFLDPNLYFVQNGQIYYRAEG